jgi:hypothetical protein
VSVMLFGAVFRAKLGVTEVSDPGCEALARTRTLLIWLGGPMGWASMKSLSGPGPWARAHGPTIATITTASTWLPGGLTSRKGDVDVIEGANVTSARTIPQISIPSSSTTLSLIVSLALAAEAQRDH